MMGGRQWLFAASVAVVVVAGGAEPGLAATQTAVDCGGGANLQAAINAAKPGTILAISGTCHGAFTVGKTLVLKGTSGAVLDAQRAGTTLTVSAGKVRVTKLTVTGGRAPDQGGGIANSGTLTLIRDTITGNDSEAIGSGIFNTGNVVLQRSVVTANRNPGGSGYAIWNEGTMTIDHSVVAHHLDGGISSSGSISISYSTISDNRNMSEPGGLVNTGTATVAYSTFEHNSAGNTYGGAIVNAGMIAIVASTIADNNGDEGGGGLVNGGTATIAATIIAGNTFGADEGPSDCVGHISSQGYNLIGSTLEYSPDPTCFLTGSSTDQIGTSPVIDAMLKPLGAYGGPTQTMVPRPHSPAVNAIPIGATSSDGSIPLCPAAGTPDQRGVPRPQSGACDIGSVERKPKE